MDLRVGGIKVLFDIILAIIFKIYFYLIIYKNNIFLFLKIYFEHLTN
jgi:hypothetical protein